MNKLPYKQHIGFGYEYFVLNNIRNNFDKVWHWKDFPEKLMYENNLIKNYDTFCKYRYDIGADLVAFKNGIYYFIQCKNFNDTIYTENLAGFYFLLLEYNLNGILYYNGSLSQRIIELSNNKIQFINLPFNNQTILFDNNVVLPVNIRNYQQEAYNKLKGKKMSILNLPCGMGKTYTAALLAKEYDNIIILSPLRYLASQILDNFKIYLGNKYTPILISIDGKRDLNTITSYLTTYNIISATYNSADVVLKLIDTLKNVYLIIDEFHNLSNANQTQSNNDIYKIINSNNNKIFLSATPLNNFMNISEDFVYNYSWTNAIKNKYICDFKIYIPDRTKKLDKFINQLLKISEFDYDVDLLKKAYFMLKSMLYNGDKKCICYLTTIEKAFMMGKYLDIFMKILCMNVE